MISTRSKVAVVKREGARLVVARPTTTSADIGTSCVPTTTHVAPSLEIDAVMEAPRRARRSRCGMIPAIPTLAVSPPVVVRCWNTMPFAGVIVSEACIESAVSAWADE